MLHCTMEARACSLHRMHEGKEKLTRFSFEAKLRNRASLFKIDWKASLLALKHEGKASLLALKKCGKQACRLEAKLREEHLVMS